MKDRLKGLKTFQGKGFILTASLVIFFTALGVRLLSLEDTRHEIGNVQMAVAGDYRRIAKILQEEGILSFFSPSSPLADPNNLGHPPGYSMLLAVVYGLFGESNVAVQLVQITFDAFCAVLIFLILAELLATGAGVVAGLLAALSPQFALNSVLLLPDSLAVFPILLSVYLLALSVKRPRLLTVLAAGVFVGLSCWLRANALLLAPFMAAACWLVFERGRRARYGLALLAGAVLAIAPLTIRNAIVFRHFVPLSLGAGQTFLEGLAEYDQEGRFGLPDTDLGVMKWEAEAFNRPDYYGLLFSPDGIERDRMRLKHGLSIVRSNPGWFASVMVRRAASMLRLERARRISSEPPVSHTLDAIGELTPVWTNTPQELKTKGTFAPRAAASLTKGEQMMELTGDDSNYGEQLVSAPFEIRKDTDYVLTIPFKILRGRMSLSVKGEGRTYAHAILETEEMKSPEEQPERLIKLPFVSADDARVRLVFANAAPRQQNPQARIGGTKLFALGAASNTWTRILRSPVNALQRLYITAVMLPLAIFGIIVCARLRAKSALIILLTVPAYYLSVHSATHTEYRYILSMHYFLFAFAALSLYTLGEALWRRLRKV